jgi:hypothetical protein
LYAGRAFVPKLQAVVTDIGTVPETYRELYQQQGDVFVLDADVEAHPSVNSLRSTMKKERDRANELDKKLKAFGELTPEEAAELRELKRKQSEGGEKEKEKEKVDLDALRKKWRKEVDDEYAPKLKEIDTLRAENRKLKLEDRVRAQALKSGIVPEDIDDVMLITSKFFDLDEKDRIVVLDEEGDPSSVTLEQFFDEKFKKLKPKYYAGTKASGSGANGSQGAGGSGPAVDELNKLPPAERMRVARERGITK